MSKYIPKMTFQDELERDKKVEPTKISYERLLEINLLDAIEWLRDFVEEDNPRLQRMKKLLFDED